VTKYLISFPSDAMVLADEEFSIVSAAARAVIEEAKAAGVYVFAGGVAEDVDPLLVSADGSVSAEIYPGSELKGGFTVLELPTREDAVEWARKIAVACRCSQELARAIVPGPVLRPRRERRGRCRTGDGGRSPVRRRGRISTSAAAPELREPGEIGP
jgi:hypothetical protein